MWSAELVLVSVVAVIHDLGYRKNFWNHWVVVLTWILWWTYVNVQIVLIYFA